MKEQQSTLLYKEIRCDGLLTKGEHTLLYVSTLMSGKMVAGYLSLAWRLEIGETATACPCLNIKQLSFKLAG